MGVVTFDFAGGSCPRIVKLGVRARLIFGMRGVNGFFVVEFSYVQEGVE